MIFDREKLDKNLHWTTFYSEKLLLAVIGALTMFAAGMDIYEMLVNMKVELVDRFIRSSRKLLVWLVLFI